MSLPPILDGIFSSSATLHDILAAVEAQTGEPTMLDLNDGFYRGFVASYVCSLCGKGIEYYGPIHDLFDVDLFCGEHSAEEISNCRELLEPGAVLSRFSLRNSEPRILAMSLAQLGIPPAHILTFRKPDGSEFAMRTAADIGANGDLPLVLATGYDRGTVGNADIG